MALAKAQVRFGSYDEAVTNAALARRLHPMAPGYYPYVHGQALYAAGREDEAQQVMDECLLDAPRERQLPADRGGGAGAARPGGRGAQPVMARLIDHRSDLLRGGRAAAAPVRRFAADGALPRRPRRGRRPGRHGSGGDSASGDGVADPAGLPWLRLSAPGRATACCKSVGSDITAEAKPSLGVLGGDCG